MAPPLRVYVAIVRNADKHGEACPSILRLAGVLDLAATRVLFETIGTDNAGSKSVAGLGTKRPGAVSRVPAELHSVVPVHV